MLDGMDIRGTKAQLVRLKSGEIKPFTSATLK